MDELGRYRWIAANILPYEAELRGWLRRRVRALGDSEAPLHFAQVDDPIRQIDQEIDLCSFLVPFTCAMLPRTLFGEDAADSERLLDLRDVRQAGVFERIKNLDMADYMPRLFRHKSI
jgi:hypothetical protein